ncbi:MULTISPECIES: hypothetical protein [unclassified Streptomyces]|uniref:hypothetical protein n=1 Tax=unclassified Streptomyces TaxID=2593676 RepID=UPI0033A8929D
MDPSVVTVAVIAAALVVRTTVAELREPGSARREWAFVTNSHAMAAGTVAALLLGIVGWLAMGYAAVAWSTLACVLVASIVNRRPPQD